MTMKTLHWLLAGFLALTALALAWNHFAMEKVKEKARIDALKEVASIGAGHAATALSLMTGARIMIEVPMVTVGQLSELAPAIAAPDAPIVSVMMDMNGSLTGKTLLALPVTTGRRLADLMRCWRQ